MIALLIALPLLLPTGADDQVLDQRAAEAYRGQDYGTAAALWQDALQGTTLAEERGRLLYNLGNTAFRRERPFEAVGWYTAALRLTPRDGDLWTNLELARSEAGLDPADRGDLASTSRRLVSSLTRAEAEWLLLLTLLAWGGLLAGEALRGGRTWRRLAWLGLALVLMSGAPLAWHLSHAGERPLMVVQKGGTQGRSEPRPDAAALDRLEAGQVVQWRDELPGWVGVHADGKDLWVRATATFDLDR